MTTDTAIVKSEQPPAALVVGQAPTALLPTEPELRMMEIIAATAVKAVGMIPANVKTPEQAMAILIAGWELGLRPMTALRHVYCVNGKTEIETRAMVGIIRARNPGIQFSWPEYTQEAVTCVLQRPGQPETRVRYTAADAKASGQLAKPGPWQQFRRDMLYAAATKRACRLGAPDLINAIEGGLTTVDEAASMMMPATEARVLDALPEIPHEAYDEGDSPDEPLAPEVEAPDPRVIQQQILDDIKRARQELGDGFTAWAQTIREAFPAAFANGKPAFGDLDAETLTALAARVRADVGAQPEMAL